MVDGLSVATGTSGSSGSVTPSSELSVEKASHAVNGTKLDFSSSIRAEVAKEHKDTIVGLEVRWGGVGQVLGVISSCTCRLQRKV